MAIGFGFRENVRLFLKNDCLPEEQDAFYKVMQRIRSDPVSNVIESPRVNDPRLMDMVKRGREFAMLGRADFVGCRAVYAYFPRRKHLEVLECQRIKHGR